MNRTLGRLLGLHQALWSFDPWYRRAWFIAPQALSLTALVVLLVPGNHPPPAAEWAKPVSSADYQLCANTSADYKKRGMACDRLISLGTLPDPELSVAYLGRGWMRYKSNQPELAMADDTEAIKHDPNNAGAYNELGAFLLEKNDPVNALRDFNEAIRSNPKSAQPRAGKAEALRRQGELSEALAEVNKALEIDQNLEYARNVRDDIQAGIKRVERTTVKNSADYQLCADKSADYKKRGMACDRLISLGTLPDPELSVAYLGRGWMRYKSNQPELAMADNTEAIKHDPNNAGAYNELGAFLLEKNDPVNALRDFNEAIRSSPEWAQPRAGKAEALRRQGELSEALAEVNKALEIDQHLEYAHNVRDDIQADIERR